MVKVWPGRASGRETASVTDSPGQGRHSRARPPARGSWCTVGMPLASTCQTGPASRRQSSTQGTESGAFRERDLASPSTETQAAETACGPRTTLAGLLNVVGGASLFPATSLPAMVDTDTPSI